MKTTFSVVGDMLAQRRIPAGYEGYEKVQEQITKGDARFVNLETTLHNGEYFGNQFSGGSYLRAVPETLDDVKAFGFNLLSFANNHSMDFAHGGLMATKRYVDAAGIANTGAGANLDEAAAPAYLDTPAGRVALISTCTMDNEAALAGKQSRRFPGRPGVNGMRLQEYIQVTEDQLRVIREIADASHVNAQKDIERAEGYFPPIPEGIAVLKDLQFKQGDETKYITHPHPEDMARVEKAIYEARMQADYILVSIHSHELSGDKKENPSDFLKESLQQPSDHLAFRIQIERFPVQRKSRL